MSVKFRKKSLSVARNNYGSSCLTVSLFLAARSGFSQQALHNSWNGQSAATQRKSQMESQDYTYRIGDFKLLATPSMSFQYNDNVNLVQTAIQDDFIVSPNLGLRATFPISEYNVLNLNIGVGYNQYIKHPELSGLTLTTSSDSGISYGLALKDFSLEVHDRVSYTENSQEAAVAGSAEFRNLNNSAGFSLIEDLNKVKLNFGYDHQNTFSLSGQFQSQNSTAELLVAGVGLQVHPRILIGLDSSATFNEYDQPILDNNINYSIGVHADIHLSQFIHITPRVGYTITDYQHSSATNNTPGANSYYFDLTATHDVTKTISYSFSVGRETRAGIQADAIQDYYFRPNVSWSFIPNVSLTAGGSFEHGDQGGGNGPTIVNETYNYYGGNVGLSYQLMKRLTSSLGYQYTYRTSTSQARGYAQNIVSLSLAYHL